MERRPAGTGSIYYSERAGLWVASVSLGTNPRRRKVVRSRTREGLEPKLAALGIDPDVARPEASTRPTSMARARSLGTHTDADWFALCRASAKECPYCGVRLTIYNDAKDHVIPVSRGGSDAVDNLQRICWECNLSKGAKTPDEYHYTGPYPRPFNPHPLKRQGYLRGI